MNAAKVSSQNDLVVQPPDLPPTFDSLVLPVDKPSGWTSFDVIRKLRRLLRVRKIGHAGTLDPMATGLLICLVGRSTKRMEYYMHLRKRYEGTIRLGQSTDTYDADGQVVHERPWEHVTDEVLQEARLQFVGDITQRTPPFSAAKVGGERLYKKARRGEVFEAPLRSVTVHDFELTGRTGSDVDFAISCSRGTYIRSIAHELGEALGCGAHLVALRRTAIGDLRADEAWTIEALERAVSVRSSEADT